MSKSEQKPKHADKLKAFTVWISPEFRRQMKILAAEQDTDAKTLVIEALNDCLVKYGKARVRCE